MAQSTSDKGMLFFFDWREPFSLLNGEDFKTLFLSMLDYKQYGIEPPEFEGVCRMAALFVFPQLERSLKAAESGRKGGNARAASRMLQAPLNVASSSASSDFQAQNKTKTRQNKTETKTDSVAAAPAPQKKSYFVPPTLDEVQAYINERKSFVDARRFFNFYSSKGWTIGNQSMKDWKAAIRTWEQRDRDNRKSKPALIDENDDTLDGIL